jgi:cyclophilin family peptidyl-prolyl cis-trans isomerase
MDAWTLGAYVELIRLEERQFEECPPLVTSARKQYTAILHTTQGDITIELLPEQAPLAVNSFVFLARQGWYDGVPFHRVIPGFVTQTGDPSGTGLGGPGYTFADEIVPGATFDRPGVVGMAHPGPDQNGSQFFITYAAQPQLDGKHTLFGQVVAGIPVAETLTVRDPASDSMGLPPADKILSIEIVEE